jgi:hypothetical protein
VGYLTRHRFVRSPARGRPYARGVKRFLLVAAAVVAVALAVALPIFEPWRAFTSSTVDEAAPSSNPSSTPVGDPTETATTPSTAPTASSAPQDAVLASGEFVDAEHGTSGTARILELADGRRFLRIEDLSSSDGPDLHVWLSEARSGGDWGSYDDGAEIRLGDLKATHGNQNYLIPDGADLERMRSVVIWCDRFNVAFGTAPIRVG